MGQGREPDSINKQKNCITTMLGEKMTERASACEM
jgi:hypothetical protein